MADARHYQVVPRLSARIAFMPLLPFQCIFFLFGKPKKKSNIQAAIELGDWWSKVAKEKGSGTFNGKWDFLFYFFFFNPPKAFHS